MDNLEYDPYAEPLDCALIEVDEADAGICGSSSFNEESIHSLCAFSKRFFFVRVLDEVTALLVPVVVAAADALVALAVAAAAATVFWGEESSSLSLTVTHEAA